MKALRLGLLALLLGVAGAQTPPTPPLPPVVPGAPQPAMVMQVLIPDLLAIRTSGDPISFDISSQNFPPATYPATYYSQAKTLEVNASITRSWLLQIQLNDILNPTGAAVVPVSSLQYRVNGGPWVQATAAPQTIVQQVGPTQGWQPVKLEFALVLDGGTPAGGYGANVTFTAVALP